jgi:hypothetical protein
MTGLQLLSFLLTPLDSKNDSPKQCIKEENNVHAPMVANPTSEGQAKDLHPQ